MENVSRNKGYDDEGPLLRSSSRISFWENDEKKAQSPCKTCRRLKITIWVLISSCVICSVAVMIVLQKLDAAISFGNSSTSPTITHHSFITALGRDTRYMSTDHGVDELWSVYLTEGLGEFTMSDDRWDHGEFSMFHQLRCLARFRLAIQRASEGEHVGTDFHGGHWAHCLDYLRRTILCNADDTVEMPRIALPQPDGTVHHGIEGAEERRTCRSTLPMCETLAERGVSSKSCVGELNSTLLPWPDLSASIPTLPSRRRNGHG